MSAFDTVKNQNLRGYSFIHVFAQCKFVANAVLKPSWVVKVDFSCHFISPVVGLNYEGIQLMSYKHIRYKHHLKTCLFRFAFAVVLRHKCGL